MQFVSSINNERYRFNVITTKFKYSRQYEPAQIELYRYYLNSRNMFPLPNKQFNVPITYKLLQVSETLLQFYIHIGQIIKWRRELRIKAPI